MLSQLTISQKAIQYVPFYHHIGSMVWSRISLLVAAFLQATSHVVAVCPPEGLDAVQEFDIEKYVDERWYSVKQLPVFYQPEDQLYCVFSDYAIDTSKSVGCSLFGCPPAITGFNSARDGSPTGKVVSVNFRATIPDPVYEPAKLFIGGSFQPNFTRRGTNYWVVAVGTYNELPGLVAEPDSAFYQWAIISGGTPNTEGNSGSCYNSGGFWFYSREPTPPDGALDAIEDIAIGLGLDTSVLKQVNQTGCVNDEGEKGVKGFIATASAFFGILKNVLKNLV
jgi:lipocalin